MQVSARYIVKRGFNTLIVIFASMIIAFLIPRIAPGDPVDLLQQTYGLSNEEAEAIRERLGLRGGLLDQFITYFTHLLRGDLGVSYSYNMRPVIDVIGMALPWSLFLLTLSISIRVVLGVLLGMISAVKQGSKLDTFISSFMSLVLAAPYFLIALFFLYIFSVQLRIFPLSHAYSYEAALKGFSLDYIGDVMYHATLPMITIVVNGLPNTYYVMKNNMILLLREDFVSALRAIGLRESKVMRAVARNAILPVVTSTAISFGYMVVGAVIAETIFSYPGMGYVFINAILNKDYPLIQGVFLLLAITISLANFISDILYAILDPRVRLG
ncbi:MAG: ABC transporter permease [Sulfolobales archaeon]